MQFISFKKQIHVSASEVCRFFGFFFSQKNKATEPMKAKVRNLDLQFFRWTYLTPAAKIYAKGVGIYQYRLGLKVENNEKNAQTMSMSHQMVKQPYNGSNYLPDHR